MRHLLLLHSLLETDERVYAKCNSETCAKSLDMTGRSELEYYVKLNKEGQIIKLIASDGTYQYESNTIGLKGSDVTSVEEVNDANVFTVTCEGKVNGSSGGSGSGGSGGSSATNIATCASPGCNKTATGTELIIDGEHFYVIGDGFTTGTKALLAAHAINTTSNTQVTSGQTKMAFSNEGYWDGCKYSGTTYQCTSSPIGLLSPYNANGASYSGSPYPYVYINDSSKNNLSTSINAYANKIATSAGVSVIGRLMTYEEANKFEQNSPIRNCGQVYWLGSAGGLDFVWVGGGSRLGFSNFYGPHGVRPVLEISTSAL